MSKMEEAGEEASSSFQEADNSKVMFEADSRGHMPCGNVHPKDKAILDLIDKFHTRRSTQWSLYSWNTWRNDKMEDNPDHPIIPCFHDLCGQSNEVIDDHLSLFVTECKNKEGENYAKETLKGIVFGLQRFLKTYCLSQHISPRTFVKNEFQFPKYNEALNKRLKVLVEAGLGKKSVQAVGITVKEEEHLWDIGIFGCSSAETLCNTVFFYIVKIFGIVSATALRAMKPETVVFGENEFGKYIEVDTEFATELEAYGHTSCRHNLALLAPNTTKLRHFCNENNPRTFYKILKYYLSLIKKVDGSENSLFFSPKNGMEFSTRVIGRNQLQRKFCRIMASAGLQGNFTTQALVMSCLDNLQVKGYMVRKKQSYMPEHQLEISKLLDPPPGIVNSYEVKSQTKAILQLVSQSQTHPNQPGKLQYVYQVGQFPQFESTFKVQQYSQSQVGNKPVEIKPALLPSQSAPNVGLQPNTTITYPKGISNISGQVIEAYKNVTKNTVTMPALTSTQTTSNVSTIQNNTNNQAFPILLQKVGTTDGEKAYSQNSPGNESDDAYEHFEQDFENVIIKQEPIDYEGDWGKAPDSPKTTLSDASRKRKNDNNEQNEQAIKSVKTNDRKKRSVKQFQNRKSLNEDETKADTYDENISEEIESEIGESVEMMTCEAEIVYSFSNDLDKKVTKQEVSLKEEGESMFSFSGTSKMGKSVGDLDINLGDYLPENCTIKPGDIDIKRMMQPDGGKMVIKLKYTTTT